MENIDFKKYYKEMHDFLNNQNDHVKNNCKIQIVSNDFPFMLHVSTDNKVKEFIPRIGFRQAESEDRTIARICVADTLIGAISGHAGLFNDFLNEKNKLYKGGYYIYAMPYEACLIPNEKLVYDAKVTGERWLVNYNDNTSSYKGSIIGKYFLQKTETTVKNTKRFTKGVIYLEIKKNIYLTENVLLQAGYYRIEGQIPDGKTSLVSYKNDRIYDVQQITIEEYNTIKKTTASLLSYSNPSPLYNW